MKVRNVRKYIPEEMGEGVITDVMEIRKMLCLPINGTRDE